MTLWHLDLQKLKATVWISTSLTFWKAANSYLLWIQKCKLRFNFFYNVQLLRSLALIVTVCKHGCREACERDVQEWKCERLGLWFTRRETVREMTACACLCVLVIIAVLLKHAPASQRQGHGNYSILTNRGQRAARSPRLTSNDLSR